jgi:superfamily II DNA/RNA helicase
MTEIMNDKDYQDIDHDEFDDVLCEYHKGKLLTNVYNYGFNKPSSIQAKTIQPMTDGRNLIAQARSGSGKTGAFVIGAYTKINEEKYPQVVILANTHELAVQIKTVASEIGKNLNVNICLCIGGVDNNVEENNTEEKNLETAKTSQLLVCTPGRLNGLVRIYPKLLSKLKLLIFDEADILLSEKFVDQIRIILKHVPSSSQICLFSATTDSKNIQDNKENIMSNPVEIYIKKEQIKVDLIKNYIFKAENDDNKLCVLEDLYKTVNICQSVIFVNSIKSAINLAKQLRKKHSVGLIHGKLTRLERMKILQKFRETNIRVLIATDVIARGIDIEKVGLIINYEVPIGNGFEDQYIHRVGRSGRYGKRGVAVNIVTDKREEKRLKMISNQYKMEFHYLPKLEAINYYLSDSTGYSYTEIIGDGE